MQDPHMDEPRNQFRLLGERRFAPYFATQLCGAFNDNVFKNSLVLLLTYHAASYTSIDPSLLANLAAGIFILPFVLFSASAGQIADKFEKSGTPRMLGLETKCLACHKDVHGFQQTKKELTDCTVCHTYDARSITSSVQIARTFNHARASDFPLKGAHENLACTKCHQGGKSFKLAQRPTGCVSCHKADFSGQDQMPRLARQRIDFMIKAMQDLHDNKRSGADTTMTAAIFGASDADLTALAHYATGK